MARLQDFQTVTPTSSDNILIVQSTGQGLASVGSTIGAKMDSTNPTGTGKLSLNRASGSVEGAYSVAEGFNCTASGTRSHAEGDFAQATGDTAHAEGTATIANHRAQHVFGQYNLADASTAAATARGNYVEIVGKGLNEGTRSNARTLDWNGNEVLAGGLKVNGSDDVQPMVALANLSANTTTTYTIPSSIFDDYGVYILAFGSNYGVGAVYILMVAGSSGGDKIKITPLVTSTYLSISAVAKNQFSATSGGANFHPKITRIA